ncbi:uncharacterized protein LOC100210679 isoform X1 [Hydra vulgaris]
MGCLHKDAEIFLVSIMSLVLIVKAELGWPSGTYGLPEPATGCPNFGKTQWRRGYTYHNTEDENPANKRSQNYHFAGNFSQHGIQQRFCIKDDASGSNEFWPEGKYCIYKKGVCPNGLSEGFVKWDDEHSLIDLPNKRFGVVPDGIYENKQTTLNFCCSTKGDVNAHISLPNLKPFYLMAYGSPLCQRVTGTRASMEFIKFDDNDKGSESKFGGSHPYGPNEDLFNTKIYYCYYEPGEESTDDLGTGKKVLSTEHAKTSSSGLAVAIGCGVAGAIVGTAAIAFATKSILASRSKGEIDLADMDPQPDTP